MEEKRNLDRKRKQMQQKYLKDILKQHFKDKLRHREVLHVIFDFFSLSCLMQLHSKEGMRIEVKTVGGKETVFAFNL